MSFPDTRTVEQVDDFFGEQVSDPYRWLEGPSSDPEIRQWVADQAAAARRELDPLPGRTEIERVLTEFASLPVETAPRRRGPHWFRYTNDGSSEQLLYRVSHADEQPNAGVLSARPTGRVLIDPNPLADNATTSIASAIPSPDGRLVAYTYSEAGSDWQTWRVRDVESGRDLDDVVPWAKFTEAEWLPDSSGFFYGGFGPPIVATDEALIEPNSRHQLRLHRLGTDAEADRIGFRLDDEPEVLFSPTVSDDDQWLLISGERGTDPTNRLWIADLADPDLTARPLIADDDAAWRVIGVQQDSLVVLTDAGAAHRRLVLVDPATGAVTEFVAERSEILSDAYAAAGRFVLHWLADAHSVLTVHGPDGAQQNTIELPALGSLLELQARSDSALLHLTFTSFSTPRQVVAHDLDTGRSAVLFDSSAPGLTDVVTEQVRYTAKDGTSVPMFLVHKASLDPGNGPHPTLLYGYGGFRIPVLPAFNSARAAFVAAGGVLAVPSLRGGGEYGARWHDEGRLENKQNVFDDAIAAAEYLIEHGWTTSRRLACTGGSNGGLLVGALITQRPDLFAAAVPEVGVLDMLRFTQFTIGWAWTSDYGDPARSAREFKTAYAYSPYHRLVEGTDYPPTLIMTSDHDDRVVPAHSYKFAARLQAVSEPAATVLLRVEIDGGHGAGRAKSAIISERTDALSFISEWIGLSW